jgi:hypothetical protein
MASMSSWLLLAAGSGGGGGAGFGGGAGLGAAACVAGMEDGGMSFMAGFVGGAAAAGALSPAGLASSSAMIRRIDARISSIEGSWTFAGCVISDSTSSTPNFTPSRKGFAGSGYAGRDFHRNRLTCPQIKRRTAHHADSHPAPDAESRQPIGASCSANRSLALDKATS